MMSEDSKLISEIKQLCAAEAQYGDAAGMWQIWGIASRWAPGSPPRALRGAVVAALAALLDSGEIVAGTPGAGKFLPTDQSPSAVLAEIELLLDRDAPPKLGEGPWFKLA